VITCHLREVGNILWLLLSCYYHMEYIWIIIGDRAGLYLELDMDLVGHSERGSSCIVPPVLIKDRPLHWTLVKSQTYCPKHIHAYGSRKTCYSLVMGSSSFQTDC
jgi:hypothetical protein